jgi:hypothetical protein
MPCPFPGMDPYLEAAAVWPAFHQNLAAALYHAVLPGLADRYRARIGSRDYCTELALFTSVVREAHTEPFVEVRQRTDNRLVTLVDFVSPTNRTTTAGKAAYLDTRIDALNHRAAVVEIDLVTQGKPPLEFDRSQLPEHHYTVTVTRGAAPHRHQVYAAVLSKRLPPFKLPLAADDRDTVIDLQVSFARAYDAADFARKVKYTAEPPADATLSTEDRAWVTDLLSRAKLR